MKLVLIIDDDKDLRQSLKKGLEQGGFAVIAAESAEEAGEILKRIAPDAIVLDRMMTGEDGLAFLRRIRAAGDGTPAIMLTAMGGADNAIDGLAGGADDYLPKPFRLRELTLRLSNLMKKAAAPAAAEKMPAGLALVSGEFFIGKKMIAMSESEKEALAGLIAGDTVRMKPMTAKRLRDKLLANMKNADIINVRNKGYKIIIK